MHNLDIFIRWFGGNVSKESLMDLLNVDDSILFSIVDDTPVMLSQSKIIKWNI